MNIFKLYVHGPYGYRQAGANPVTACETFQPMMSIARNVLQANGYSEKITLVGKRSTDMTVEGDMAGLPADIIVSEVLDSEFIGEGVLSTIRHAAAYLGTPDVIMIPAQGSIWALVIDSPLLMESHSLEHVQISDDPIVGSNTSYGRTVDIHADRLNATQARSLSSPVRVLQYEFNDLLRHPLSETGHTDVITTVSHEGDSTATALLLWWTLHLDESTIISTSPPLVDDGVEFFWRDHWMQFVHILPAPIHVCKGMYLTLQAFC